MQYYYVLENMLDIIVDMLYNYVMLIQNIQFVDINFPNYYVIDVQLETN
jgi:hypothetical protein